MTRTITPAEVKPGMEVQFDLSGWDVKGTVSRVEPVTFGLEFYSTHGEEMTLDEYTPVTVLSEPQPEEPTAFGARVVADGMLFVRADDDANPWRHPRAAMWANWRDVCALGEVTVIDADPSWTVPADVPEVPERIEEWPEDDEHLRPYRWKNNCGDFWVWVESKGVWELRSRIYAQRCAASTRPYSWHCPWTRETDA